MGDSACGPAAVKFLDLRFISQGDIVDDECVVAYRQIYEQEAVLVGKANEKIMIVAYRIIGAIIEPTTGLESLHDFSIGNLLDARSKLPLAQRE